MNFIQLRATTKTSGFLLNYDFTSIVPVEKSLQNYNLLQLNFLQRSRWNVATILLKLFALLSG